MYHSSFLENFDSETVVLRYCPILVGVQAAVDPFVRRQDAVAVAADVAVAAAVAAVIAGDHLLVAFVVVLAEEAVVIAAVVAVAAVLGDQ